jgi:uncharacterized membrane protein YkvI
MKSLGAALLVVSSIVGAGFASGREVISIFGGASWPVAAIVALFIFVVSWLFLRVGAKVSDGSAAVFGKFGTVVDSATLINSIIILAVMLSGLTVLGAGLYSGVPILTMTAAVAALWIAYKGIDSLVRVNAVLVPIMIAVLVVVCVRALGGLPSASIAWRDVYSSAVYVGLNMYLAATALSRFRLDKRQAIIASAIAACIIGALLALLMWALHNNPDAWEHPMPLLYIVRDYGAIGYAVIVTTLAACIFTTLCIALYNIVEWLSSIIPNRIACGVLALMLATVLGTLGFARIVDIFYPIIGAFGILYVLACAWYIIKEMLNKST